MALYTCNRCGGPVEQGDDRIKLDYQHFPGRSETVDHDFFVLCGLCGNTSVSFLYGDEGAVDEFSTYELAEMKLSPELVEQWGDRLTEEQRVAARD